MPECSPNGHGLVVFCTKLPGKNTVYNHSLSLQDYLFITKTAKHYHTGIYFSKKCSNFFQTKICTQHVTLCNICLKLMFIFYNKHNFNENISVWFTKYIYLKVFTITCMCNCFLETVHLKTRQCLRYWWCMAYNTGFIKFHQCFKLYTDIIWPTCFEIW